MTPVEVELKNRDVYKLLGDAEYPELFTVQITKEAGWHPQIVLEHQIDGNPTTLRIVLNANGAWQAFKGVLL